MHNGQIHNVHIGRDPLKPQSTAGILRNYNKKILFQNILYSSCVNSYLITLKDHMDIC